MRRSPATTASLSGYRRAVRCSRSPTERWRDRALAALVSGPNIVVMGRHLRTSTGEGVPSNTRPRPPRCDSPGASGLFATVKGAAPSGHAHGVAFAHRAGEPVRQLGAGRHTELDVD